MLGTWGENYGEQWLRRVAAQAPAASARDAYFAERKRIFDSVVPAARRLGVDPVRSIGSADSGPGISAALAAGMKAVAIPHWLTEGHDLTGAHFRVTHAGELTLDRLAALAEL